MNRVLLIDGDRALGESLSMACLERGIATRMAETVCEGVRYLLEAPVSVVLVDAALLRRDAARHAEIFAAVAPEVPLVAMLDASAPVEDRVKLELEGFRVVPRPFDVRDVLAKLEFVARPTPARRGAAAQAEAFCAQ